MAMHGDTVTMHLIHSLEFYPEWRPEDQAKKNEERNLQRGSARLEWGLWATG